MQPWTSTEAINLIRNLNIVLLEVGYSVGLTGGVLFYGCSKSDLDILIYPLSKINKNIQRVRDCLESFGMCLVADQDKVTDVWRKKGSQDTKHVEIWKFADKRIDIFFVE